MFLARHASHSLLGPNSPLALAMPVLRWLTLVALATACAAANQAAPASVTRAAPAKRPAWRAPIGPYRGAQRQAAGLARPADVQRGLVEQVRECWWQAAARAAPLTPVPHPSRPSPHAAVTSAHSRAVHRAVARRHAGPLWVGQGQQRNVPSAVLRVRRRVVPLARRARLFLPGQRGRRHPVPERFW